MSDPKLQKLAEIITVQYNQERQPFYEEYVMDHLAEFARMYSKIDVDSSVDNVAAFAGMLYLYMDFTSHNFTEDVFLDYKATGRFILAKTGSVEMIERIEKFLPQITLDAAEALALHLWLINDFEFMSRNYDHISQLHDIKRKIIEKEYDERAGCLGIFGNQKKWRITKEELEAQIKN